MLRFFGALAPALASAQIRGGTPACVDEALPFEGPVTIE